jgi:hypothetical protein
MRQFKKYYVGLMFLWLCFCVEAQPDKIFPPSPTVASLMKFVEVPVNLYSGLPDISIPIFEAKSRELSVPITLSYHASGIRVDDVCGWVGTNWALNAGGVISRNIYGKADETQGIGYIQVYNKILKNIDPANPLTFDQTRRIGQGYWDAEPDQFSFNCGTISGRFAIDPVTQTACTFPFLPIRITTNSGLSAWEITGEDGTRYVFGRSSDYRQATESIENESSCAEVSSVDFKANTSWFLLEMISATAGDTVRFFYEDDYISYISGLTYSMSLPYNKEERCSSRSYSTCFNIVSYFSKRISKITTATNTIYFRANTLREDVVNGKMLDSISIYTSDNVFIRKFILDYSYYLSNKIMSQNSYFNNAPYNLKRLRLDKVTEYYDQINKKPPYQFVYDQTMLPPKGSYAQDYWGYYNGQVSNKNPLPAFEFLDVKYDGANREVDTAKCKAGILTAIINPMGGSSVFTFESNDFGHVPSGDINEHKIIPQTDQFPLDFKIGSKNTITKTFNIDFDQNTTIEIELNNSIKNEGDGECIIQDQSGKIIKQMRGSIGKVLLSKLYFLKKGGYNVILTANIPGDRIRCNIQFVKYTGGMILNKYGGGIRICSLHYNDGNQLSNSMIKKYIYRRFDEADRSSGCLVSDFPTFNYSYSEPIIQTNTNSGGNLPSVAGYCHYEKVTSNPQSQMSTTNGSFVGYSEVTEVIGDKGENGKVQYKFTSPIEFKSYGDRGFPFTPTTNYDYARGLPLLVSTYNKLGVLRSKVTNNYLFDKANNYHEIIGTRIGILKTSPNLVPQEWSFIIEQFKIICQWKYLSSTTREDYDNNGKNPVITTTENTYSNPVHGQLSKKKQLNSDGTIITQQFTYPNDYATLSSDNYSKAISLMQQKHIINPVIESVSRIQKPNEKEKVISGNFVKYLEFMSGQLLPYQNYTLDMVSPLDDFQPATIISNSGLKIDSRFRLVESFLQYDKFDNLILYQKNKDIPVSILWSYNYSLPVAKVLDAYPNQSAYNGFESIDKCDWEFDLKDIMPSTEAIAGQKIIKLTSQLKKSNIPSGNYNLTFWIKGNATPKISGKNLVISKTSFSALNSIQWRLCSYQLNYAAAGDLMIDPGISIDEIRLYPEKAQMTTYSYIPSYGINSVTNENNVTSYFEYDKLGRLILTRDFDKNILQFYQYHYKP